MSLCKICGELPASEKLQNLACSSCADLGELLIQWLLIRNFPIEKAATILKGMLRGTFAAYCIEKRKGN